MYMLGRHLRLQGHTLPHLGELADVGLYRNMGDEAIVSIDARSITQASSSLPVEVAAQPSIIPTGYAPLPSSPPMEGASSPSQNTPPYSDSILPAPSNLQTHPLDPSTFKLALAPSYPPGQPSDTSRRCDDIQKMLGQQDRMRQMDEWYTSRQWEALQILDRDLKAHYDQIIALMEQRHKLDQQQVAELTRKLVEIQSEKQDIAARCAQLEANAAARGSKIAEKTCAMHRSTLRELAMEKQLLLSEKASLKSSLAYAKQQMIDHVTAVDKLKSEKTSLMTENSRLVGLSKETYNRELEYRDAITRLIKEKSALSDKCKERETKHESQVTDLLNQMGTLRSQNRRLDEAAKKVLNLCKTQQEQITKLDFELSVAKAALSSRITIPKRRQPSSLTDDSTRPTSRSTSGSSVIYHEPPSATIEQSSTHIELRVNHWTAVPAKRKSSWIVSETDGEDVLEAVMRRLRERVKKVKKVEGDGQGGIVWSREVSVCSTGSGSTMDWTVCG